MVIVCPRCGLAIQVLEPAGMLDLHAIYECPECLGDAVSKSESEVPPELLASPRIFVLQADEAFAALHGAGLRSQKQADPESVRKACVGKTIRSVRVEPIPNLARCLLTRIEFEDGSMVFLSAGTYGPTVHRLLPPRKETTCSS